MNTPDSAPVGNDQLLLGREGQIDFIMGELTTVRASLSPEEAQKHGSEQEPWSEEDIIEVLRKQLPLLSQRDIDSIYRFIQGLGKMYIREDGRQELLMELKLELSEPNPDVTRILVSLDKNIASIGRRDYTPQARIDAILRNPGDFYNGTFGYKMSPYPDSK